MRRIVNIGAQGFAPLRERNCFYVDKTDFIKEWWESGDDVTLITRPRRFGKTLNLSTLECFFSLKYSGRSDLFEGLQIWNDERYRELQGQWPVITLSFANVKADTMENVRKQINAVLYGAYQDTRFLLNSDVLNEADRSEFLSVGNDMPFVTAVNSMNRLCKWLSLYYHKKVIVLLDEYDTPMQEAYVGGYWNELAAFVRNLFNATFKTNPYLERAVLTGITRVSKESIFSDLNNLQIVTTTSRQYATAFGFTEKEVFDSLDEMGLSGEKENVKSWYDGFTFGNHPDIYNPWSITSFLKENQYLTYWANTSENRLVSKLIRESSPAVKETLEDLLTGKTLRCKIDEQFLYSQLGRKTNAIWSLLLSNGYLKVISPPRLSSEGRGEDYIYELALTNKEVQLMFHSLISDWFAASEESYNGFIKALLKKDRNESLKEMNIYMNEIALATFSYFDTGDKPAEKSDPERFYHGFVLGLLVDLRGRYVLSSNRESGYGRYDVLLEPVKPEDPAFIIEFKVLDPDEEKNLQETVSTAVKQIESKRYSAVLEAKGIHPDRIRKYGFAFQGKKVLIG